jgi:hypothetical protein
LSFFLSLHSHQFVTAKKKFIRLHLEIGRRHGHLAPLLAVMGGSDGLTLQGLTLSIIKDALAPNS